MEPIYKPKGKALEYCDLAVNIYTGCNHGCTYCYAAKMAKRWGRDFTDVKPRVDIAEKVRRQLAKGSIVGQRIHLCFTCDPYPAEIDTTVTCEVIKAIKDSGNHVQILTKGGNRAERDFDLLGPDDWFGVTVSGGWTTADFEPNAQPVYGRLLSLARAKAAGITTWVSFEPMIYPEAAFDLITNCNYIDNYAFGKLNYYTPQDFGAPPVDWAGVGNTCEALCQAFGRNYLIKDSLRERML